jgi:monofunctional biosynthetic peptidoglycan transglycosylase
MVEKFFSKLFDSEKKLPFRYHWVSIEAISSNILLAVIAAEDQKFCSHWGFDLESIADAIEDSQNGANLRGASTITQQVAKNLFLWSGRSFVRKAIEAYFTVLLEMMWPKKRILEVYVNIAEFGNGIYGVYEASGIFFKKKPANLTKREASLMAAVLPNPERLKVQNPSYYVKRRARWIEGQMGKLGGIGYIENVCGNISSGRK